MAGWLTIRLRAWMMESAASVWEETRSDWLLYLVVGVYVLIAGVFAVALNDVDAFRPFLYVRGWAQVGFGAFVDVAAPFAVIAVAYAIRRNPARPFTEFSRALGDFFGARLVAGLLLVIATAVFYGTFTSVKDMLPQISRFGWDRTLANIDRLTAAGYMPTHAAMNMLASSSLPILEFIYGAVWFILLLGLSSLVVVSRRFSVLRCRFMLTFFCSWILAGNVLAGLFLSGGPCFYGPLTGNWVRFGKFCASLSSTMSDNERQYLWYFYQSGKTWLGTGISAFPSVHLVSATLVALLLVQIDRRLAILAILYVAVIEFGSVRLGWHYAIDGYAGIAVTLFCWWIAGIVVRHMKTDKAVLNQTCEYRSSAAGRC